jgi:hypothetical protein
MQRGLCAFAAACLALVSSAAEPQSRLELRKVALTGEGAPGAEPGLFDEIGTYVDIFNLSPFDGGPTVGTGGGVALVAEHGGDGLPATRDSAGSGVWRAASGVLEAVALEGDAAPGAAGATFTGFPSLSAASPGEHVDGVAFAATAAPVDGFELPGLWSTRGGSLGLLLLQNRPLAGLPPGSTASGRFAFVARGPSVLVEASWCDETVLCALRYEGLWRDVGSGLQPVVRQGQPAPGFGSGVVFDDLGNTSANTGPVHLWNGSETGRVIFNGYVRGQRIDSGNNEGLWLEGPLGLALLAREGERVPGKTGWRWGAASGLRGFGDDTAMRAHILTTNGLALWGASINNRKYNRVNGVWSTRSGAVVQLVQTVRRDGIVGEPPQELATPAPGFGPGHRFRQVFSGRMNTRGDVYLDADVADEADPANPNPPAAIFRIPAGSPAIELVARRGGAVPGVPGATFTEMAIGRLFDTGDYLWMGRFQGEGVDASNDQGAFLTGTDGITRLVLRTGDAVDVSGDGSDTRVLASFGTDTDPRGGGAAVRQAFELLFTDGSAGVFVGEIVSGG